MDTNLTKARDIIRRNPSLIWYTKSYGHLSPEVITETIFNHGSWNDFQELRVLLGTEVLADIFLKLTLQKRCNLHFLAKNYFTHYFAKYVPKYSD
jgi:hypothetical protein